MILKHLSFIQSCNRNLTDFLKLRNFDYDLVLFNRRQHFSDSQENAKIYMVGDLSESE